MDWPCISWQAIGGRRMSKPWLRALIVTLAVLVAPLLAAGCGGGNNNTTSTSAAAQKTATPGINVPKDPKIAAEVPQAIKSKGTLTVASDAEYAPNEFIAPDGHTIVGMDADL